MSFESQAVETLQSAALDPLKAIGPAVSSARDAQADLRGCSDLVDTMGATAQAIMACEALQEAVKQAEKALRTALARAMAETGATTIHTRGDTHTVSLREAARLVRIIDATAIPAELMTTPTPQPDRTEIGRRIKAGETVPGAELTNGGDPTISIRSRAQ